MGGGYLAKNIPEQLGVAVEANRLQCKHCPHLRSLASGNVDIGGWDRAYRWPY